MRMFKAYSVGLQERDFELIRKITKVVTTDHVSVKDLRYYDIKLEDTKDNILFIFGSKASRLAQDIEAKQVVHLPEISTLHANTGIDEQRLEALKKLNLLKTILETDTIETNTKSVLKDPVPDLELSDLKILESTLKEKKINKWLTTTTNGKTVQISIVPESTEADINITFCELYTLKIAMDTLDIKEFTVVYSNN
tara:strand:- start:1246 stop:1833 length:588 start_codon:yes stop_codon:yes gene_type:complete